MMLTLLLILACSDKDDAPLDSLSDDSAAEADTESPGDSAPADDSAGDDSAAEDSGVEDWGSPELFGSSQPTLGALRWTLDGASEGGSAAQVLVTAASAPAVPAGCGSFEASLDLLWSPDAEASERWSAAVQQVSVACAAAPPAVVWVLSPRLLQAELLEATASAVTQASALLGADGGQVGLVLMGASPQLLAPLTGDPALLQSALEALPEPLSGDRGALADALALAAAELEGQQGHIALLLEDADLLAFTDLGQLGFQQPFPLTHVVTMGAPELAEGLSASTGGRVLEAPTRAALVAGAEAIAGFAQEALTVELLSPTRPRQCPALHGALTGEVGGEAVELLWSTSAPCPAGMPTQFQDRFLIDPIDEGGDEVPLSTPELRYGFGPRRLNSGAYDLHRGIDYELDAGGQLVAVAPGVVAHAGWDRENYSDSGIFVVIDHGDGLASWYVHLDATQVSEGDVVARGAPIGVSGSTETSVAHLHFSLTACSDCEPGDRPDYTDNVRNPMWLLPRADGPSHTVSPLTVSGGTLSFEVTVPADEADLQEIIVRTSGGERALHVDDRENLDPDEEVVNGISALPSAGPNNRPITWAVTFEDVAASALQEVEVIDLAGHSLVVTP